MTDCERARPRLIAFSDTTLAEPRLLLERFTRLGQRALPNSVLFVLRDYQMGVRERWALGQRLSEVATRTGQRCGLAERADLAKALGCTGFHLPGSGFTASDARRYLGRDVFISRGSHELLAGAEPELDGLLLSPIFEPRKGRSPLGLDALARVAQPKIGTRPALFALGGVTAHNAAACLAAGMAGVAAIGAALMPDPDPLLAALGIARG